jgi:hypothetical protein
VFPRRNEELRFETTVDEVTVMEVKFPLAGVVPPIVPGLAQVWPSSNEALRFGQTVVEVTVIGAVPLARVEVICPEAWMVV